MATVTPSPTVTFNSNPPLGPGCGWLGPCGVVKERDQTKTDTGDHTNVVSYSPPSPPSSPALAPPPDLFEADNARGLHDQCLRDEGGEGPPRSVKLIWAHETV